MVAYAPSALTQGGDVIQSNSVQSPWLTWRNLFITILLHFHLCPWRWRHTLCEYYLLYFHEFSGKNTQCSVVHVPNYPSSSPWKKKILEEDCKSLDKTKVKYTIHVECIPKALLPLVKSRHAEVARTFAICIKERNFKSSTPTKKPSHVCVIPNNGSRTAT